MSLAIPDVIPSSSDWQREENVFLFRFLAPALCVQVGFLSYHQVAPAAALSALINVAPALLLIAYLGRVLHRARGEGQFYLWGRHD
jgi:hypothetical protein